MAKVLSSVTLICQLESSLNKIVMEKNKKEPTSFVDLVENFTREHPLPFLGPKVTTVPIYLVNKTSGKITTVNEATINFMALPGEFCKIQPYIIAKNSSANLKHFSVKLEDKYNNKLINIVYGSFYAGNYELFLHKKNAVEHALNILYGKRKKLNEEIHKLIYNE